MNRWSWFPIILLIFIPLVWVRDLKSFNWSHILVDILAILSLGVICYMATQSAIERGGFSTECLEPVGKYWPSGIGVSLFTFEGQGTILTIKGIIKKPEQFRTVVTTGIGIFAFICIFYSEYSLFGYGAERSTMPLVTESMPRKSPLVWTIKVLYCAVVGIMHPLMCFPATEIIDSYTVSKEQPRWKRVTIENSTRTAVVVF